MIVVESSNLFVKIVKAYGHYMNSTVFNHVDRSGLHRYHSSI
jgi:hypothetical protein